MRPVVSVVVPTVGGELLPEMLASLRDQVDPPAFEVVVVDNTPSGLEDLGVAFPELNLRVVRVDGRTRAVGHNRNAGARVAVGERLVFLDDDDRATPTYLARLNRAMDHAVFVTGVTDRDALNAWDEHHRRDAYEGNVGLFRRDFGFLPFAGGGTLGIHRSIHDAVGGFDPDLLRNEDPDYCWRIQGAGQTPPVVVADAILEMRIYPERKVMLRKAFRDGYSQPRLYRNHRASGMPRDAFGQVAAAWWQLAKEALGAVVRRSAPGSGFGWRLSLRFGRAVGSVRHRALYL